MPRHVPVLVPLATALALLVSPQAASPGVDAVSGKSLAAADQTFTDPTGDSRGRLDVTSVHASSSGDRLDIRVRTREKTINSNEHIWVDIDTNFDGTRDLGFYFRGGGAGTLFHTRYPGPLGQTPSSLGTTSGQDFGITFNLRLSGLGNPARIKLSANSKEAPLTTVWDRAPDAGLWDFVITAPQPPPPPAPPPPPQSRPRVKSSFMRPSTPQAGQPVVVGANFVLRGTNRPARGGSLSCGGSLGGADLSGRSARTGGTGTCTFRLPGSAAGKRFTGRVTLDYPSGSATAARGGRVGGGAELTIAGPKTDGSPRAGQNFGTTFRVRYVRPGGSSQNVADGEVTCEASVGGKRLGVFFKGFFEGRATCSWNIPASARGSLFVGKIVVRYRGLAQTKTFRFRVR